MLKYNKGEDENCTDEINPTLDMLIDIALSAAEEKDKTKRQFVGGMFFENEEAMLKGMRELHNQIISKLKMEDISIETGSDIDKKYKPELKPSKSWNNTPKSHLHNIFIQEPIKLQNNE